MTVSNTLLELIVCFPLILNVCTANESYNDCILTYIEKVHSVYLIDVLEFRACKYTILLCYNL